MKQPLGQFFYKSRCLWRDLGQRVEKPQELSGKICPREVLRESLITRGTSSGQILQTIREAFFGTFFSPFFGAFFKAFFSQIIF